MFGQLRIGKTDGCGGVAMISQVPGGRFYLKEGIRLVHGAKDGLVLQLVPLRVIRVNTAAMDILEKCRTGFSLQIEAGEAQLEAMLSLCDTLYDAEILDWIPPPDDPYEPVVSIIVPVFNRAGEIGACIESLQSLNYPESKREIIVVDDASRDHTAAVVRSYNVKLIIQPRNMGQSAARNAGALASKGDIIAFIDSDCIADRNWLRELLPYFHDPRLALIGGFVEAFFRESSLDRYEKVHSPLNMGSRRVVGKGKRSVFYVPTCNMLIKKDVYSQAGGLDEQLRVGEDVDFCWKLMSMDYRLMYVPKGRINHKQRNRFYQCFRRRFDYGTSEAVLYDKYRHLSKQFPLHWEGIFVLLIVLTGMTTRSVILLLSALGFLLVEPIYQKIRFKGKFVVMIQLSDILKATLKHHLMLAYHFGHHLTRYYLLPVMIVSILIPQAAPPLMGMVTLAVIVEFLQKKPRLSFFMFAFLFCMEQLFYQAGVFRGCLKQGSFRLYRISFAQPTFFKKQKHPGRFRLKSLLRKRRDAAC